jgi:hypothetical protein
MDNSDRILIAICDTSVVLIDLDLRKHFVLPGLGGLKYAGDSDGNIFTCGNNLM